MQPDGTAEYVEAPFTAIGPLHVVPDSQGGIFVLAYHTPRGTLTQSDSAQTVSLTLWHRRSTTWTRVLDDLALDGVVVDPGIASRPLFWRDTLRIAFPYRRTTPNLQARVTTGVLHLKIPTRGPTPVRIPVDTVPTPTLPTYVALAADQAHDSTLLLVTVSVPTGAFQKSAPRLHSVWLGSGGHTLQPLEALSGDASSMMPEVAVSDNGFVAVWTRSEFSSAASSSHFLTLGRPDTARQLGKTSVFAGTASVSIGGRLLVIGKHAEASYSPAFWLINSDGEQALPTEPIPFHNNVPTAVSVSDSMVALVTVGLGTPGASGASKAALLLTTISVRCSQ